MFVLDETFAVPDVLFEEELSEHHPHLLGMGLQLKGLEGEAMLRVYQMNEKYRAPSLNDLFALELARVCECPILTGDRALRNVAEDEGVEFHGTIWLVEELIQRDVITVTTARIAYGKMRDMGSRLPWKDAEQRLAIMGDQDFSGENES